MVQACRLARITVEGEKSVGFGGNTTSSILSILLTALEMVAWEFLIISAKPRCLAFSCR